MLKLIEGLPPDVLGIEAAGKVTHDDYREVLIPAAEAKIVQGPIRMLYVAGSDFTGYELEALWDDAAFGFKHWHQFKRIAVVTDSAWLRAAITMFRPFFPSQIRLFRLAELAAAKDWIIRVEQVSNGGRIA
ncbi:STAS/SEC14 domain-containing protein [Bradyrhizobium sp. CCBAU 51627]|uniref:STAS/SEC14 domain-containing protein n=1 Tax=Bradyrhizobium sp. CCBAU 51627 TaxID=1325088 RepID=UPI002306A91D|nr:STAS/SEC14 domain-containing protein [Bradyrhizobium sp. CCBAU 51627]MDA9436870.1 hypothetical protein [Bradyrhizobium sp. CCBAU 51627]